jgi:primary-amine oxidase
MSRRSHTTVWRALCSFATDLRTARSLFGTDNREVGAFVGGIMSPLAHITRDLFGGEMHGRMNDTLITIAAAPLSYDGEWRRAWHSFRLNVPGSFLHPIDFYLYIDSTGTDPSTWKVLKVVYNHQVFTSIADFVAKYESGELQRSPMPEHKSEWAARNPEGKGQRRDLDDRAAPRSVMVRYIWFPEDHANLGQFEGPRYRIDHAERYVTWMGWSFYLGFECEPVQAGLARAEARQTKWASPCGTLASVASA